MAVPPWRHWYVSGVPPSALTEKVTDWPAATPLLTGCVVMAGVQTTARAPVAVAKSPVLMVLVACTVKDVVAAGVEPEVLIVSVDVCDASPEANETVVGLKEALTPVGNGVVVTLRVALNAPVPVPRFT